MIRRILAGIAGVTWLALTPAPPVEACLYRHSVAELVEKAQLVVIGVIEAEFRTPEGITHWRVRPHYYLRGEPAETTLIVLKPLGVVQGPVGSSIQGMSTGLPAPLQTGAEGAEVLLFLRWEAGAYRPVAPEGVVLLEARSTATRPRCDGTYLQEKYRIEAAGVDPEAVYAYWGSLAQVVSVSPTTPATLAMRAAGGLLLLAVLSYTGWQSRQRS